MGLFLTTPGLVLSPPQAPLLGTCKLLPITWLALQQEEPLTKPACGHSISSVAWHGNVTPAGRQARYKGYQAREGHVTGHTEVLTQLQQTVGPEGVD